MGGYEGVDEGTGEPEYKMEELIVVSCISCIAPPTSIKPPSVEV